MLLIFFGSLCSKFFQFSPKETEKSSEISKFKQYSLMLWKTRDKIEK